jgi:hypothetical protein
MGGRRTEHYETVSQYNASGILTGRVTNGEVYDINGMVVERYTTTATQIDGYSTVREDVRVGEKLNANGQCIEHYETTSRYSAMGILNYRYTTGCKIDPLYGFVTERYTKTATIDLSGNIMEEHLFADKFDMGGRRTEHYETVSQYNASGILTGRVTNGEVYDINGMVVEIYRNTAARIDPNGNVLEVNVFTDKFDKYGNWIEHSEVISQYNASGTLTSRVATVYKFDQFGMPTEIYSQTAIQIDNNGIVREDEIIGHEYNGGAVEMGQYTTHVQYDARGIISNEDTQGVTISDGLPIGVGFYHTVAQYDASGILRQKMSEIEIPNADSNGNVYVQTRLHVSYDINESGQIVFTHVYDSEGNEVPELGGEGCISPSAVILRFAGTPAGNNDNMADRFKNNAGYQAATDQNKSVLDSKIAALQAKADSAACPAGISLVGELAAKPKASGEVVAQ